MMNSIFATAATERILVIGGMGRLGRILVPGFINNYGVGNVVVSDIVPTDPSLVSKINYTFLDVAKYDTLERIIRRDRIKRVLLLGSAENRISRNKLSRKIIENTLDVVYKEAQRLLFF